MIDVISSNFESLLPEILLSIEDASFIAIDTEFTGLVSSEDKKPSLFDTGEQRYNKLKANVSKFVVCQFGLATFRKDQEANRYWCHAYNFYLRPPAFGSIDHKFTCEPSALEFLSGHGFDFNKFIVHGIPYLNEVDEEIIWKEIKHKTFLLNVERDVADRGVQRLCSEVSSWLTASTEQELLLEKPLGIRDYVLVNDIRQRFMNVWATVSLDGKIIVHRVTPNQRADLEYRTLPEDEELVTSLLGFTRVFRKLVKSQKPIVGHNVFTDLLFIYRLFYHPLPKSYKTFKCELHKLFPEVFDTKHISLQMRRRLETTKVFELGCLAEFYGDCLRPNFSVLYGPHVVLAGHATNDAGPEIKPHNAGFDAYATGYVFLRMAHILAMDEISVQDARPLEWTNHYNAMKKHANHLNLIRALTHHMNMNGPDPPPNRPQWLVVQGKNGYTVNPMQVAEMFSSIGSVDVKALYKNEVLVAVGSFGCARDILRAFHHHEGIQVSSYNRLRHSRPLRLFLWSACIVSSSLSLYLISKLLRPSSFR